jgi:acyl-homoserine lactone acylase PvdQ
VKFAELASKRVNRATHMIGTVGNLSNRSNYDWTEQDVKKIVRELRKAVKEVENRFLGDQGAAGGGFVIKP